MADKCLVVDLCGTLVRVNTTHGFLTSDHMPVLRRFIARLLLSRLISRVFSFTAPELQRRCLVACLAGMPRSNLQVAASKFAEHALANSSRESVLACVRKHRQMGAPVYVASASLDFIVEAFSALVGGSDFVATQLAYRADGICMGRIARDSTGCKLARIRELLRVDAIHFDVITDNPEDTDLMDAAENFWFVKDDVR